VSVACAFKWEACAFMSLVRMATSVGSEGITEDEAIVATNNDATSCKRYK